MCSGLPRVVLLPGLRQCRAGCRLETEKPVRPALGLAPAAGRAFVADLAAGAGGCAGKGEMAVGWLCVSTFISTWAVRRGRRSGRCRAGRRRHPALDAVAFHHRALSDRRPPCAAGSASRCCGSCRTGSCLRHAAIDGELALKILCRQCSLLACANIISCLARPSIVHMRQRLGRALVEKGRASSRGNRPPRSCGRAAARRRLTVPRCSRSWCRPNPDMSPDFSAMRYFGNPLDPAQARPQLCAMSVALDAQG